MAGWDTADLVRRLLNKLGRGTAGVAQFDEVWTPDQTYECLADAQEAVYTDFLPLVPKIFIGAPVQLSSADGGVTYDFPAFPFGHVEVYGREDGGRELFGSSYADRNGDFVFEGQRLRMPGNQVRSFPGGIWARYGGYPVRIAADQEPMLNPAPARELIQWRALSLACDVWGAELDPAPFEARYDVQRMKWLLNWQNQAKAVKMPAPGSWWLTLDRQF